MIEDILQDAVEDCADALLSALKDDVPNFLAVHFLCGDRNQEVGYIRKSAARLTSTFLQNANIPLNNEEDQQRCNERHRDVLREQVRSFDREFTLLNYALAEMESETSRLWLHIGLAPPSPGDVPDPWKLKNLRWPETIDEYLIEREDAVQHLRNAYEGSVDKESAFRFTRTRSEAYGRWMTINDDGKEETYNKLQPLQSSLIYFEFACDDGTTPSGDLLVFPLDEIDGGIFPLVAVITSGQSHLDPEAVEDVVSRRLIAYRIGKYLNTADDTVRGTEEGSADFAKISNYNELLANVVTQCATSTFAIPGHRVRFEILFKWMALLIQNLTGTKHEGHTMDFWFVAGDLSEFEDDPDIDLTKRFDDEEIAAPFSPPSDGTESVRTEHLTKACKLLEKEHFPWFQRGRHALFFDLSHERMLARGLCKINRSSWEFQLGGIYRSKEEQQESPVFPACLVGFVSQRRGGTGIAVCQPQSRHEKSLRLLARFTNGSWRSGVDLRDDCLQKVINNAEMGIIKPENERLSTLCQLIADHPNAGGTFVLLRTPELESFVRMGEPWEFDSLSLSEQIPLVAHDGATLVTVNDGITNLKCRYMLTPDQLPSDILRKLHEVSMNHQSPLASVGSRRWSSAMTAFRQEVQAVVVISQDGGITCYRSPGLNDWNSMEVQEMPAGRSPDDPRKLDTWREEQ